MVHRRSVQRHRPAHTNSSRMWRDNSHHQRIRHNIISRRLHNSRVLSVAVHQVINSRPYRMSFRDRNNNILVNLAEDTDHRSQQRRDLVHSSRQHRHHSKCRRRSRLMHSIHNNLHFIMLRRSPTTSLHYRSRHHRWWACYRANSNHHRWAYRRHTQRANKHHYHRFRSHINRIIIQ